MLVRDIGIEPDLACEDEWSARARLTCTSTVRCQPRINTFHHPENLLRDEDDDEDGTRGGMTTG
jgi:hypothetical protein